MTKNNQNNKWFHTDYETDYSNLDQSVEHKMNFLQKQLCRVRIVGTIALISATVYILVGCGGGSISKEEAEQHDMEMAELMNNDSSSDHTDTDVGMEDDLYDNDNPEEQDETAGRVTTPKVNCVANPSLCV